MSRALLALYIHVQERKDVDLLKWLYCVRVSTQPATPEVINIFTAHFPKWDLGGFVSYFKKNTEVFLSYKEQS